MLHSDLALALESARKAGEILRGAFGQGLPVEYKSAHQPVTEADREADLLLRNALCRPRPTYGWMSEETPERAWTVGSGRIWVVDPLDGTTSFLRNRPEFAISIGLLERGTPILGVVYNPVTEEMYHAVRGGSAFRGDVPIRASERIGPALTLMVSPSEVERDEVGDLPEDWRVLPLGSTSLKIVRVAEGVADAYLSSGPKEIWDVCGGAAIAAAAGAHLLTAAGEAPRFSIEERWSGGVIVVSDAARGAVLRGMRSGGMAPAKGGRS
jgi:myo-inositol-1(or 4)-monophosphatase